MISRLKRKILKLIKGNISKNNPAPKQSKAVSVPKYHTQFTIKEVCDIIGVEVPEKLKSIENDVLTNLAYTAIFVRKDGGVFLRKSKRKDIGTELEKAVREGAKVVFTEVSEEEYPILKKINYIHCERPFSAVIKVSEEIRKRLNIKVVGLTGSLGKTTTKDIVHKVLSQSYIAKKSMGNQNTIYPLFENLQKLPPDTEFFVQEFGAASPGTMPNTVRNCIPDAGIITNISDPHLDKFGTKERILQEKLKLIELMDEGCPAFLNYDNEYLANATVSKHPIISYAVDNKNADYYAENIQNFNEYIKFDVVSKEGRTEVVLYSVGIHNIYNALAAFAVGKYFGMTEEAIVAGIADYKGYNTRQNFTNIGGYNMYIDCYNNAPLSLVGAVKTLEQLSVTEGGRRIAVIGDMSLLGEREKEIHKETAEQIAEANIDIAMFFGEENAKLMADVVEKSNIKTYYTDDRKQLNDWIRSEMTKEDILLFKGPVVRLLSRTIDQIFGTSFHLESESGDELTAGDFRLRVLWEKYNVDRKTVGILKYLGSDKSVKIEGTYEGANIFTIGPNSFLGNKTIEELVIAEPITNIALAAFKNCSNLREVTLPESLINIEQAAFRNCTSLRRVVIPGNVIEIGKNAFRGCKGLKEIVIPPSVGRIGEDAFTGCTGVKFICEKGSYADEMLNK